MAKSAGNNDVKSKNWKCKKCGSTYSNPLPCTAVMCSKCTKASGGIQKWMSPAD